MTAKSPAHADPKTSALSERFQALAVEERAAIAVLAVHGGACVRSRWADELGRLGVRHPAAGAEWRAGGPRPTGRKITTQELGALVSRPEVAGLIGEGSQHPGYFFVHARALPILSGDAHCQAVLREVAAHLEGLGELPPAYAYSSRLEEHLARCMQSARAAVFLGDAARCQRAFDRAAQADARMPRYSGYAWPDLSLQLLPRRPPESLVRRLPPELRLRFVTQALTDEKWQPDGLDAAVLRMIVTEAGPEFGPLKPTALCLLALGGDEPDEGRALSDDQSPAGLQARAMQALCRGEVKVARDLTVAAWQATRGPKGTRKPWLDGPLTPLLTLVLATGDEAERAAAELQVERAQRKRAERERYAPVKLFFEGRHPATALNDLASDWLTSLLSSLVGCYLGEAEGEARGIPSWLNAEQVRLVAAHYERVGLRWLAAQLRGLLVALGGPPDPLSDRLLVDLAKPVPAWQRSLQRIQEISARTPGAANAAEEKPEAQERLAFVLRPRKRTPGTGVTLDVDAEAFDDFVRFYIQDYEAETDDSFEHLAATLRADMRGATSDDLGLSPRELAYAKRLGLLIEQDSDSQNLLPIELEVYLQKRGPRGYSKGKPVSLRRMAEHIEEIACATEQDLRVAATLGASRDWHGKREFFPGPRTPLALVGHPHVFLADDKGASEGALLTPREVVRGDYALRVVEETAGLLLRLSPQPDEDGMALYEDALGRLTVCELSAKQREVRAALEQLPPIPGAGRAELDRTLTQLTALFPIHAAHSVASGARELTADPIPTVQVERAEPGVVVRVVSMPLGPNGPSLPVGEGMPAVTCQLDGEAVRCARNLDGERAALQEVTDVLPQLAAATGKPLHVDELEPCLQLLQGLRALGDRVHVVWVRGEPLSVLDEVGSGQLNLQLSERKQWLEMDGSLQVDEALVLSMRELLADRPLRGFVQLGKDRYVPLSADLASQLAAVRAIAAPRGAKRSGEDDGALRIPPVALGFVSPWLRQLRSSALSLNPQAKKRLAGIDDAMRSTPAVPRTLEAELRPYQQEGFAFMSRLARIGAGAVLADDMGLGKTLMTLALLLERAPQGPALVVAPVSVKANWCDEALRFAPTLSMLPFGSGADTQLDALGPFDVVLCSYGAMTQHAEALGEVRWSTLVLDEAQAIKNPTAQRSKAARTLVADARVALTGTPIENNLGDLYSIMSFLNPGLLGSAKQFESRFGKPIQREGDAEMARTLRALIAPFTLRRRKADVLRELPPKTEITLSVEPDDIERAFVEALRQEAVARLAQRGPGEGAVSILAEITRLRRAACHPKLVDPAAGGRVSGAKLARAVELLQELKAEGHRALVFSQFVDFLQLVGKALAEQGLSYQYLDGSTSERKRKAAVSAFQSGEGDAFLISLKAGGFGLNLTAADYVMHLDPWWNPAAESQASDRAHRIGQRRPVTVYRLVNAGSIEERVLSLHAAKRELADDLLQDAAQTTRLDAASLMALLE